MAQTTGATSSRAAVVEVSTNGSSWTDISGYANMVDPGDAARNTGETYTADGDTAIITRGKRPPIDLKLNIVYTEGGSDPTSVVRSAYENATDLYVRYTIKASATGVFRYTSDAGTVTKYNYPKFDADDAKPVMCAFTLKTAKLTEAAVP